MAGFFSRLAAQLTTARVAAKPYTEQGTAGFTSAGGYIVTAEKNAAVAGPNRWHTAQDLLTNVSIIAASVRYSLNLISRPAWRADPPSDKPEAKAMAEFVEEVINGADTSWARIVRRAAVYRYHGFNLQEWVAKKRDDGKIGIQSVEQRPAHTVRKWDLDDNGGVLGVVQASPQTGEEIYLPRRKLVYLVDDALTDSPEGLGWFRHLADPAQRLRRYLKLETMGFERDLNGIPVGRAPLQRINQLVEDKKLSQKQADAMIKSLEDFVRIAAKQPETRQRDPPADARYGDDHRHRLAADRTEQRRQERRVAGAQRGQVEGSLPHIERGAVRYDRGNGPRYRDPAVGDERLPRRAAAPPQDRGRELQGRRGDRAGAGEHGDRWRDSRPQRPGDQ
jgi:hypothetical protein